MENVVRDREPELPPGALVVPVWKDRFKAADYLQNEDEGLGFVRPYIPDGRIS